MSDAKFHGWAAFGADSVEGNFKEWDYTPKPFDDDDIEIDIHYCGICGSDIHTAGSGWGDMSKMYPMIVGHEIVGKVVKAGPKAEGFKEGDLVGIGAQCDSCLECSSCKTDKEQYCDGNMVGTYTGIFQRGEKGRGHQSQGGYADKWRGPSHFAVHIPSSLDPAAAAPMLCGGTTVYSPLKKYGAGTTAKDVGVIGIGGLGHFALVFAKAMGANVTAITHGKSKIDDAKEMGASNVIVTGDDAAAAIKGHERSLDLIVCSSNDKNMPLETYLQLLRPGGYFILVGVPESKLPAIGPGSLIMSNKHLAGSLIGSPKDIAETLEFAAKHKTRAWTKKYAMDNINEAVKSMYAGEARYRYVLVNEKNGGKLYDQQSHL